MAEADRKAATILQTQLLSRSFKITKYKTCCSCRQQDWWFRQETNSLQRIRFSVDWMLEFIVRLRVVIVLSELFPELGRKEGVEVLELSGDLVPRQLAVLVFVRLRQQSVCFCLVFVVLRDDPLLQLLTIQFAVAVPVQVFVEVALVRLERRSASGIRFSTKHPPDSPVSIWDLLCLLHP